MKRKRVGRPKGSKGTPWVRIEAAIASDAKVIRAGMLGGLVWRALLEMMKIHGWRGSIPKSDVDGRILWKYLNCEASDPPPEAFDAALQRLESVGLLTNGPDGTRWSVKSWAKYNGERFGKPENGREQFETVHNSLDQPTGRDVTGRDVTEQDRTKKDSPPPPTTKAPSAAGDVTSVPDPVTQGPVPVEEDRIKVRPNNAALASEVRMLTASRTMPGEWMRHAAALEAAGCPARRIVGAIRAASPVDKPWDAFASCIADYSTPKPVDRFGKPLPPEPRKLSEEESKALIARFTGKGA